MAAKQIVIAQRGQWKRFLSGPHASFRWLSSGKSPEKLAVNSETGETVAGNPAKQGQKVVEDVDSLTKEVATLKEANEILLDKYRRSLSDGEKLKARLNKQIGDARIFGIQDFCKDLLEVADILGSASKCVPKDQITDRKPHLKKLYCGLKMTKESLMQVFKRHGLEPINPIKEKFNPNMHEALFQKMDVNAAPDTVVEVTKLGYKLHQRVIRPALVGVSAKPL